MTDQDVLNAIGLLAASLIALNALLDLIRKLQKLKNLWIRARMMRKIREAKTAKESDHPKGLRPLLCFLLQK